MYISVEATRWTWIDSLSERSARLVMLCLAAHCNEDGYSWPSMETLCTLTRLSKPIVLQAIEKLVEHGEVTVERGGKGAADTNRYFMKTFMEGRVNKGKENLDKGKETPEKVSTRVDTNNKEQEVLEQAPSAQELLPDYQERVKTVSQRLEDYYNRRWQTDERGRYLISPSTGNKIYEEEVR